MDFIVDWTVDLKVDVICSMFCFHCPCFHKTQPCIALSQKITRSNIMSSFSPFSCQIIVSAFLMQMFLFQFLLNWSKIKSQALNGLFWLSYYSLSNRANSYYVTLILKAVISSLSTSQIILNPTTQHKLY